MKPRFFLSPAFIQEVEPKLYGLFRSVESEEFDREKGRPVREKIKDVGPIGLFREVEGSEKEDLVSFHPIDKRPMKLKRIE